jgi:hypothetical protein
VYVRAKIFANHFWGKTCGLYGDNYYRADKSSAACSAVIFSGSILGGIEMILKPFLRKGRSDPFAAADVFLYKIMSLPVFG